MTQSSYSNSKVTFLLIYLTFFLDNVLLTVVVPMMWSWVHPAVSRHSIDSEEFTSAFNGTHVEVTSGRYSAAAGVVLGAKASVQLASCGAAAAAVRERGPRAVLRAATAILAAAALVFAVCSSLGACGAGCAGCALLGRVLHGGGAALAAVGGLALAARAPTTVAPLLSAVALGAVAGYTCGGAAGEAGGRRVPFLLLAIALLINLALQYKYMANNDEYEECVSCACDSGGGVAAAWRSRGGRAAAAAVFVSTCVVATLEPCLPMWLHDHIHTRTGWSSLVFVSDSVGYLAGTVGLARAARAHVRPVAVAGLLAVAAVAATLPLTSQLWMVCALQATLGAGIGATDAALFPAIIAPSDDELQLGNVPPTTHVGLQGGETKDPGLLVCGGVHAGDAAAGDRAALLHAAASAAYAIGPVVGGLSAWACGLGAALLLLAVLNAAAALALTNMHTQPEALPLVEERRLVRASTY